MSILYDSDVVVTISFVTFIGILGYYGIHKLLFKALDDRAAKIRADLDEARMIREEAQATFAEFERRQRDVASQAEEIVEHARADAQLAADQARKEIAASIERRLRAATDQIAMAEQNAVREVRNRAITVAIAAADQVLRERLSEDRAQALVDESIEQVATRLH
jgi:F-type H+-transporting ATPase subunit b